MPKIAISYRRADTDVMAGRIRDRLAVHYGEDAIFMDIDNIPFGEDFRAQIFEAIVQSDILLVIVGQRWLGTSRGGSKKIDDETDFVRLELETAISNAVPIIPVLAGSARMPHLRSFPKNLKNVAFLNAAPVCTGAGCDPRGRVHDGLAQGRGRAL
ncbi:MAG TPA: toll/interleukin-1 receptor domain-containing protein [Isosphaeraceae bacterium]|nr:toll/interleukin-1 receptor domain-containing protein [Isosphaeraceae bacterium]